MLAGLGLAQKSNEAKGSPAAREKLKNTPRGMVTGKVTQVDPKERTFILEERGGRKYTFVVEDKTAELPKVNVVMDVTYTGNPDDPKPLPAKAIALNSSRSNVN